MITVRYPFNLELISIRPQDFAVYTYKLGFLFIIILFGFVMLIPLIDILIIIKILVSQVSHQLIAIAIATAIILFMFLIVMFVVMIKFQF